MPTRSLPVRPDRRAIEAEAESLLAAMRAGDVAACAELQEFLPGRRDAGPPTLHDAREVLGRSYQGSGWTRLVQAVTLVDAIWNDDIDTVRALVSAHPALLHEPALIRRDSNWGPPLSYAANLGRDGIIRLLHSLGATDLEKALQRAALQGQVATGVMLHGMLGSPVPTADSLGGPAYTLSVPGTQFLLGLGVPVVDASGERTAPVAVVLETDSRNPAAKHAILAAYEAAGLAYPDTPVMALHRGRIDLLEAHLARDPALLTRTFRHRDIYPADMGCRDPLDATTGTPLDGCTLLHMCVEYDELEIARWLLDRGMSPDVRAHTGASGFGGWTPLFHTAVSQPNFWLNHQHDGRGSTPFAALLLERGADPLVRASLWKRLHPGHGDASRRDYRDVTALSWGRRFHDRRFVSDGALALIAAAGGVE
ncbi:MAG: ankyrin repeat domain-containing protein [Gemmatimonadaceae bacterium]|nr:ankyrin repeat domain-containing protein [Gemmatimonadaceae bacterium]